MKDASFKVSFKASSKASYIRVPKLIKVSRRITLNPKPYSIRVHKYKVSRRMALGAGNRFGGSRGILPSG